MKEYSSDMIASQIGSSQNQVETWAEEFCIPFQQKGVSRSFREEAIDVLKTIKAMKEDGGSGFNTIRRKLDLSYPQLHDPISANGLPGSEALKKVLNEVIEEKLGTLLDQKILELADMAEKYAQASYQMGIMTEQNKQLEENNNKLKAQLKILPSPDEWVAICEREKTYQDLLYGLQERIDDLEAQLAEIKGEPWPISPELKKEND